MPSTLIILNNYFHDVATATLLSSAVILHVLWRQTRNGSEDVRRSFARAYSTLTRFAWGALAWIIVGGIPRTIFFTRYEFIPATNHSIVVDLVIKHVLMAGAVLVGAVMWVRIGKTMRSELARPDEQG